MANRHLSRSIVLQTLFEWDFNLTKEGKEFSREEVDAILKRNLNEFAPGLEDDIFVASLLDSIFKKKLF